MIAQVVLTREPLSRALEALEDPWRTLWATPATSDGDAGACLDFYGIVRRREVDRPGERVGTADTADTADQADTADEADAADAADAEFPILALEYEAHEAMAKHQMELILSRLSGRYPLQAALVIHRIGRVEVGEASLLVRLLAPHRQEALRACAEFIDELKQWVPIWKQAVRLEAGSSTPARSPAGPAGPAAQGEGRS